MSKSNKDLMSKALLEIRRLKKENQQLKEAKAEPIAIVGMACRFPGSDSPKAFWEFLEAGKSAIKKVPKKRWSVDELVDADPDAAGKMTTPYAALLDTVDEFDAGFFGVSPKEAQSLDPQQRLLLEMAWEAMEDANIPHEKIVDREVGVFVGMSGIDYALKLFDPKNRQNIDPYFGTGSILSPAAGRLSYFMKLTGPSMVIDTACSSSLVSIHNACESIRRGECESAFAGGVNLILSPQLSINFSKSDLLAQDGHCYTFDARAQGYSRGEGAGMFMLKKLSQAKADGDRVHSVILGSAVNQDGGSGGLTVPRGLSQQQVVKKALHNAGLSPDALDFVETHGTATPLGDPIEANSLGEVFNTPFRKETPLILSSVKTNLGHLEAAAGMASALKVVQALKHECIPPHLNFKEPNPHIDWENYPLKVGSEKQVWLRGERPRVAGINGFGFAGTNAHIIFAEAPAEEVRTENPARPSEVLTLSAKTEAALNAKVEALLDEPLEEASIGGICQTSQNARTEFRERLALPVDNSSDLRKKLTRYLEKGKAKKLVRHRAEDSPEVAFVFTGQGSQYAGMGEQLYRENEYFRKIIDSCASKLEPELGLDIREILFEKVRSNEDSASSDSIIDATRNTNARSRVDETRYTQPSLFVVEYALAKLWQHWGVDANIVIGHSIGEYAAACIAGVFSLDDGLKMVAARGRLMEELSAPGEMANVFGDEEAILKILEPFSDEVSIAAVNGPGIILISGASQAMQKLYPIFEDANLRCTPMRISHAFHSPMTEPVLDTFRDILSGFQFSQPTKKVISNVTGGLSGEGIATADYWVKHLRGEVRFCESMTALHNMHPDVLLEIGPEPTILGLDLCFQDIREAADSKASWATSLQRNSDDWPSLTASLARLWAHGVLIDWSRVNAGYEQPMRDLPTYPFQRKRHWFPFPESEPFSAISAPVEASESAQIFEPLSESHKQAAVANVESFFEHTLRIISNISGLEPADLDMDSNLLEMGLDSLMFVRIGRNIEKAFNVEVSMKQFYEELHKVGPLVLYLEKHGTLELDVAKVKADESQLNTHASEQSASVGRPDYSGFPNGGHLPRASDINALRSPDDLSGMDAIMMEHMSIMRQYLDSKRGGEVSPLASSTDPIPYRESRPTMVDQKMRANFAGVQLEEEATLSQEQKAFLNSFIEGYCSKRSGSKERTAYAREHLADWKHSLQFKQSLKALKFPIVSDFAEGGDIVDIDGNRYIDVALGMGVHLFGHKAPFIQEALKAQIKKTTTLGPQSILSGEVAKKIKQLTGVERVSLAVTGSGAVLMAQRIARAAKGKPLIAQFGGAYHGIGSEVLMMQDEGKTIPLSPGIPHNLADNVLFLDYGSDEALDIIREYKDQLSAVMVEPVQSRRPDLQPQLFLRKLRALTEELDLVLIFDEMINGFRIHAGGAQAWFGIKADLVTYGKIIGGGMPLSVVAGKAEYLDLIDGGNWSFEDRSQPSSDTIFTGGTHNRHPLALASSNAVLDHMISEGPELHAATNRLTAHLTRSLNHFFEKENVSLRASSFGSQFRIESIGGIFEQELFHYVLTDNGVYTWEQRINCISTEHTDSDIQKIIDAVKASVHILREGGFKMEASASVVKRVYPMSSVQQRLFALSQREGAEMPYHLSGVWKIIGKFDFKRAEQAFQTVINRHESLRTAFVLLEGDLCQYIYPEPRFSIARLGLLEGSPDRTLESFIGPFDLSEPPLMRVGVTEVSENENWLYIDVHHIAADGMSMSVILTEFANLYQGIELKPVSRQYRHAQKSIEKSTTDGKWSSQEAYWKAQFADEVPLLDLPLDRARPHVADFSGNKLLLEIDAEMTRNIEKFAARSGSSLFMVLLGAFATLLHRLTESEDLVIGLPVGGRVEDKNEDVVGMFVNSLPLRLKPKAGQSFKEFLVDVRSHALSAYDNQDFPFGELLKSLGITVAPDRNPGFDVMFAYENADERIMKVKDWEIVTHDQFEGSGMFDFNVDIIREHSALSIRFHYASAILSRETVERWMDYYASILKEVVTQPEFKLGTVDLISASEQNLLHSFALREHKVDDSQSWDLLSAWNAIWPAYKGQNALSGKADLTYLELEERSNQVAQYLIKHTPVDAEKRVAVALDAVPDLVVSILGILKTGAAFLPIDPTNPIDRNRTIIEDSEAVAIITDLEEVVVDELPQFSPEDSKTESSLSPDISVKPESLAYMIYTSGSTGTPKAVMVEHQTVCKSILWRCEFYDFTSKDVTLQMPSVAFDAAIIDIFPTIFTGGELVMLGRMGKQDLRLLSTTIEERSVSNILLTPSLYRFYLREISEYLSGLRFITVAGEATNLALLREHFDILPNVRLINEYGPTENSIVTTACELFADTPKVTIGRPVPNTEVRILNKSGEVCPIGVIGEITISGDRLARGYHKRPEENAKVFEIDSSVAGGRAYKTGDLGRWTQRGEIEYIGRKDDQVKIRGFRVELDEIVNSIEQFTGVSQAYVDVVGVSDTLSPRAYVAASQEISIEALKGFLASKLPHYMVPTTIALIEEMPLTPNGKVNRRALPEIKFSEDDERPQVAARSEAEAILVRAWQTVLKQNAVSIEDDYFQLGGDSIKGIQIASILNREGWSLDTRLLYKYPSIANLAPHLNSIHARESSVQLDVANEGPLNAIQNWFTRTIGVDENHFNQSIWLEIDPSVAHQEIEKALRALEQHHPALRLRVKGKMQSIGNAEINLKVFDYRLEHAGVVSLDSDRSLIQENLNLINGPVWAAGLFKFENSQKLLVSVHHMFVDGVSWRILFSDFSDALAAIVGGRSPSLAPASAFTSVSKAAFDHFDQTQVRLEVPFWQKLLKRAAEALGPENMRRTTCVRDLRTVEKAFSKKLNDGVISRANRAFNTHTNDLLLAALRLAYESWNSGANMFLEMEAHGRSMYQENWDVSRTVGWFTSSFPVFFERALSGDLAWLLKDTKETLHTIPNSGDWFAHLRELSAPETFSQSPVPEMSFNYLGKFDGNDDTGLVKLLPERPGNDRSPNQNAVHTLALFGLEIDGTQQWTLEYDTTQFTAESAFELLDHFEAALHMITSFCTGRAPERTPADFVKENMPLSAWEGALDRYGLNAAKIDDVYPLSPMQEGLLFEALRAPETEAYFEQMTFKLEGRLNMEAFEKSWQLLIDRYPVLRSAFLSKELEDPVQAILTDVRLPIDLRDISHLEASEQTLEIKNFELLDRKNVFSIHDAPLMRLTIFKLDETHVHIVWSHHHLLMDGWCVGILYSDWQSIYASLANGGALDLEAPTPYSNYVRWLTLWDRQGAREYWTKYLAGFERLTTLPRSSPASLSDSYHFQEHTIRIEQSLWKQAVKLAAERKTTAGNLLQATWAYLLSRYSHSQDVVFGLIVSGRPSEIAGIDRMVGLFINAIPVRVKLESETRFEDVLHTLQEATELRESHVYLPLAEINDGVQGLNEAFDHLFVFENYPMEAELRRGSNEVGDAVNPRIYDIGGFERTHLDFNIVIIPGDELEIKFTYNAEVFTESFIERVAASYREIVTSAISEPLKPLKEVFTVSKRDLRELQAYNNTGAAYPKDLTITALFESVVEKNKRRAAIKLGGDSWTYAKLNKEANKLARLLASEDVQVGDRVASWLPRGLGTVVAILGIQKAGAILVPLDQGYPESRTLYILKDSRAMLVLDSKNAPCEIDGIKRLSIEERSKHSDTNLELSVKPDAGLYIIYTSGSTGKPKGCVVSHRNLLRLMQNDRFDFDFTPSDVWVVAHSFCFDFSVWELYGALLNGGKVVIAPSETVQDTRAFVDLVLKEGVTVLNQTPAAFYSFSEVYLARQNTEHLALRYVIFGGDRLEPAYLKNWIQAVPLASVQLINMYGITETTVHVTYHAISEEEVLAADGKSRIGRPLPETQVWVLDDDLNPLPVGVEGELYVSGSGVSLGYWERPELTDTRFVAHPGDSTRTLYKTGDLGRWREDGVLEYLGRNDFQVQIRGFRIELGEIESALLSVKGVEKAVVIAHEEAEGTHALAGFYSGAQLNAKGLKSSLSQSLPVYMLPAQLFFVEALPQTSNNKIDRRALLELLAGPIASTELSEEWSPTEKIVAEAWQKILECKPPSPNDNFFDLGGHSLKAVRLASELESTLGVTIELKNIFEFPTVRAFTANLSDFPEPTEDANLMDLMNDLSPEELESYLKSIDA